MFASNSAKSGEAAFPIDISYAKFTDWLVDRKQVPPDWRKRLSVINARSAEALRELPPDLLEDIDYRASTDAIDYFVCVAVRNALVERGADKGLFGGLKGSAGVWDRLVKAYEKDNVWLVEAGRSMAQAVDNDVPAYRRQSGRAQQQLADLERRQAEYLRSAANAAAEFKQERSRLGLGEGPVDQELRQLLLRLPTQLSGTVRGLQTEELRGAAEHYADFSGYTTGKHRPVSELLPACAEIMEGRCTPWEGPSGVAGADDQGRSTTEGGGGAIDWDLGAAAEATAELSARGSGGAGVAADIDWDLDLLAADNAGGNSGDGGGSVDGGGGAAEVDWDLDVIEPSAGGSADAAASGGGINWDIEITEEAAAAPEAASFFSAAPNDMAAATAGHDLSPDEVAAVRVVEDAAYRGRVVGELLELRAFLAHRAAHAGRGVALHAGAPEAAQQVTSSQLTAMRGAVDAVLEGMTGESTRQLLLIKSSARYQERTARQLRAKAGQEEKFKRMAVETEHKRLDVQRSLVADAPKLQRLLEHTAKTKREAERGLSVALGGRKVHIIGEISNVIKQQQ